MSLRYTGAWMQDGAFNPLTAPQGQTPSYTYYLDSWGNGSYGKLGLDNTTYYSSPKQIGSLTDWSNISCGEDHTMALKTDGSLWVWGQNSGGQLGIGNVTHKSSPVQVGTLTTWNKISGGNAASFAIKTDGTLWAWGATFNYGSLGLGNNTYYSSPKQVGSLTNWASLGVHMPVANFAIKTDGTLWAWGFNNYGQLGLGNTTNRSSPVQVGSLTNWLMISSSTYFAVAVKTNGTLWSWGYNVSGQLGLGNTNNYSSPKQVGTLTNWLSVSCGYRATYALKTDGTIWSWGANNNGCLGLGNTTYYSSPKQIGSLTNWQSINAPNGAYFATAIKTDGTLWAWGQNGYGQLGDGTTVAKSSPIQVGSLSRWYKSSGGYSFTIGMVY